MMNAYFVETKEVLITLDVIPELGHVIEYDIVADVVFAETRGQARARFIQEQAYATVEWTDIKHVQLLAKNVDEESSLEYLDHHMKWPWEAE